MAHRLGWSPVRLVLGTTFGAADLIAYAAGGLGAWAGDEAVAALATRRARPPA